MPWGGGPVWHCWSCSIRCLIDGSVGVIVAPFGRLSRVLIFTFAGDKVTLVDVIGDRARLRELEIVAL